MLLVPDAEHNLLPQKQALVRAEETTLRASASWTSVIESADDERKSASK